MTRARRAVATLLWIVTCISCGSGGDRGDETGRSESAIINGTAITDTAEVEARKVVYIRAIQIQGGKPIDCVRGSGTLLTNDWILTAAHVMDPDPEGLIKKGCSVPVKLSEYKIFLGDPAKSAQSRDPNVVAFHPRWRGWPNPPTDTDVALVHVSSPFLLGGSTTVTSGPSPTSTRRAST